VVPAERRGRERFDLFNNHPGDDDNSRTLDASPETSQALFALIAFDSGARVVEASRQALNMLGVERSELVGSHAEDAGWVVLDGPEGPLPGHPVLVALRSKQSVRNVVVRARRRRGPDLWLQLDAVPVVGPDDAVEQVLVSLADVTHLVSRSRPPGKAPGEHIISEVVNELAEVRLQSRAVLFGVTRALARTRSGTWVAALLDKDPATCQVVAADSTRPELVEYVNRRLDSLDPPGHAATQGITLRVIETGQHHLVKRARVSDLWSGGSTELDAYLRRNPIPFEVGLVDLLAVPMRARGMVVGVLSLYETQASNPLGEGDIGWMQAVADRTAVAVENAQLYEDAVRRLERLTSLQSLSLALSASPDLRLTLNLVLDQVTTQLKVDAADVLLLDQADETLSLAASAGFFATSVPDYRLPLEEGIPGQAVGGRRIITVTALSAFSQFRRRSLFAREGFKAYGAVPLITRGKLLGALEVFHRTPLSPDAEWSSFFEALGSVAAIAIDSASMQDRLRRAPAAPAARPATTAPRNMSRLELQILRLAVEGMTNREIAAQVHLSQNTVKFHMRQIFQKTQTSNRTELAHNVAKEGWA
jgi:DNA-binding CsgD family transcriptional regulator